MPSSLCVVDRAPPFPEQPAELGMQGQLAWSPERTLEGQCCIYHRGKISRFLALAGGVHTREDHIRSDQSILSAVFGQDSVRPPVGMYLRSQERLLVRQALCLSFVISESAFSDCRTTLTK